MATTAAVLLSNHAQTTLGSTPFSTWHAMFKAAGASTIGNSSGKPYSEFEAYLITLLTAEHPMVKRFKADFSAELNAEASR